MDTRLKMNSSQAQDEVNSIDGVDLFNANLLERVAHQLYSDGLIFRPLNSKDYDKGFLQLLGQLTNVGNVTRDQFLNRFYGMKCSGGYYVIIVEDLKCKKVIGSATLVIEQKFIHNCGLRGHLEDVVVNKEYRGKQLGKLVVMAVKHLARSLQCYKLTLECRDRLIPFYESLGFNREPGNANSMNVRFPHDNPVEQSRL
ncbi:probable glucosamine 6-phosphate N-acetyltransferase [Copidosoma floridanum]|uniref:probable glucosamine 6-phosphate N-acetyltransferase n=1 Tax=Copidosoma floridanum TaxID=29053 RepID=UPI0006C9860B|nr:probable glucosamine 6-phosphate N-acetyltransferase [Copidosoma floridanum]